MTSPKDDRRRVKKSDNELLEWIAYLVDGDVGPFIVYVFVPLICLFALVLLGSLFKNYPVIPLALLVAIPCVLVPLILFRLYSLRRKSKRVKRDPNAISEKSKTLILELLGSYSPYVIEAAEALGSSGERAVVPELVSVLKFTVRGAKPGWEEIAIALIVALGNLGDSRALPVLESMLSVKELSCSPALLTAIKILGYVEFNDQLLHPASCDPAGSYSLLRPSTEVQIVDGAELLRPAESSSLAP